MSRRDQAWWSAAAGALATLLAALLTVSVSGDGAPPLPGAELALDAAAPLTWSFTTEQPDLHGLRLWLARPAPAGAEVTVSIAQAALPDLPLAEATLPLSAAADGPVEVGFPPLRAGSSPHVLTSTLEVRLSLSGLAPGESVALQGAAAGDPAFVPLYQARPFDTLWPISRMAAGRPGLIGWPPLYPLLAYGTLIMLLRGLWHALRAGSAAWTGQPPPD